MYDIQVFDDDHTLITDGIATHNSDSVIEMFRDEVMISDREMKLKVLKNREGSPSNTLMAWDFRTMNFSELFSEGLESEEVSDHENVNVSSGVIGLD
jgi:hypothetical protein